MPNDRTANMSMEQLDALIAERSKPENLPEWYIVEQGKSERQLRRDGERRGKVRRIKGRRK